MYQVLFFSLSRQRSKEAKKKKITPDLRLHFPPRVALDNVSLKSKLQHPPWAYPGHLTPLPFRGKGNLIIRVFQWVGNLIPRNRGGEFEMHPRFHVKSLAWQAIMGDAVLEDFVEKIIRVVAN